MFEGYFCLFFILFYVSLHKICSSPVGGGNAPKCWLPTANQIKEEERSIRRTVSQIQTNHSSVKSLKLVSRIEDLLCCRNHY